ncbi:MAG: rhodanese-like domain-containing protein [Gammaproteobacteria bacterium]|nr:rhodanese-like domain-containing protein [Gammaproteobacteria bacterium]MDH3447240.1 rhodanese-like domain-containing protein [Gammaproteobacteria bacterium]
MSRLPATLALAIAILTCAAQAAPAEAVKSKWHTPYGLYLTPQEAYRMKSAGAQRVLLIDVRTRAEVKYIGFADAADANIPVRMLRDDYAWSEKSGTYRTRENPDFVAAVERLLELKGLDRDSPIILMCQSGSRVPIAAGLLHEAGFGKVYTQYQGFEGIKAKQGPDRGKRVVNGWKNAGLPWSYELDAGKMYFNFAP